MFLKYPHLLLMALLLFLIVFSTEIFAQRAIGNDTYTAEKEAQAVKVGVHISPPFVMVNEGKLTGMAIDLWKDLAQGLNLKTTYIEFETVQELVDGIRNNQIDVAVTNLTITKKRAKIISLTHAWFDSGLRVMVSEDQSTSITQIIKGLKESGYLRIYVWIAGMILFSAAVLMLYDRHFDKEFPRSLRDGFAESFYTIMSVVSTGRLPVRKNYLGWLGRISQGLWMFFGLALLAYLTSSVTSVMTTISLTNQINSAADLDGRRVGVFTGSIAEKYAHDNRLNVSLYAHISEAVQALQEGEIHAIIADGEVLEYYDHTNPSAKVKVVGPIFEPSKYGFGVNAYDGLIRPLNIELIGAHESGLIAEIRRKYFGEEQ